MKLKEVPYFPIFCILQIFIFSLLVESCSLYKEPANSEELVSENLPPDFIIPEHWTAHESDTLDVASNWYTQFNSTELNELVTEALDTLNPGILFHLARIEASNARIDLAKSGRKVQMNYTGIYAGSTLLNGASTYNVSAAAPISWEVDLWGKIKAGILAAEQNKVSEIFQYAYTRQSIAAEISELYFRLATINNGLEISEEFIELNEQLIEILKIRERVGRINRQDIHIAESQLNSINSIIQGYENLKQIRSRNLEILLGRYPSGDIQVNWQPDTLLPIANINDPLSLISRRPDIRAFEANVKTAFYLTEQAKLAKYPSLKLSATPGVSNIGTLVLGTGVNVLGPIFNGGALNAVINEATAIQKQTAITYSLSLMTAFNEVETSLAAETVLNEDLKYNIKSAQEIQTAYEIATKQYEIGQVDLYYVILLQNQYLLAKIEVINKKLQLHLQRIQLFLALGGDISTN